MFEKLVGTSLASVVLVCAQIPNPTQRTVPQPDRSAPNPIFRIEVVARSAQAVNYRHRGGSTKINFQGTAIMPMAKGEAIGVFQFESSGMREALRQVKPTVLRTPRANTSNPVPSGLTR